jgi:hypothetical protein
MDPQLEFQTEPGARHSLKNGEVWATAMFHRAITQWIDGDQWVLLGVPDRASHGGTCMVCFSEPGTGAVIQAGKELEARLKLYNWARVSGSVALTPD